MIDLSEIKKRCEAAFPGPWNWPSRWNGGYSAEAWEDGLPIVVCTANTNFKWAEPTAEFIAHARQDVPALIAEVERLREESGGKDRDIKKLRGDIGEAEAILVRREETIERLQAIEAAAREYRDEFKKDGPINVDRCGEKFKALDATLDAALAREGGSNETK